MSEQCWFDRFVEDPARHCTEPGVYGKPDSENSFVRATRWCVRHKHHDDILLAIDPSISADEAFGTTPADFYVCQLCGKSFHRTKLTEFMAHAEDRHGGDVRGVFGAD